MSERQTFQAEKARKHIAKFVESVDDPVFNWSWEVTQGLIHAYANASIQRGEKLLTVYSGYLYDFLAAWHGGEANYGLIGMMQEFGDACPDSHEDQHEIVMAEAFALGRGEKPFERVKPAPVDVAVAPAPPVAVAPLRLVVDNTGGT